MWIHLFFNHFVQVVRKSTCRKVHLLIESMFQQNGMRIDIFRFERLVCRGDIHFINVELVIWIRDAERVIKMYFTEVLGWEIHRRNARTQSGAVQVVPIDPRPKIEAEFFDGFNSASPNIAPG